MLVAASCLPGWRVALWVRRRVDAAVARGHPTLPSGWCRCLDADLAPGLVMHWCGNGSCVRAGVRCVLGFSRSSPLALSPVCLPICGPMSRRCPGSGATVSKRRHACHFSRTASGGPAFVRRSAPPPRFVNEASCGGPCALCWRRLRRASRIAQADVSATSDGVIHRVRWLSS